MERIGLPDEPPLHENEDFLLAESLSDEGEELAICPIEGKTPEEAAEELPGPRDPLRFAAAEPERIEPAAPAIRFSLWELFAAITFVSISLAASTWMPLEVFVGVAGLVTVFLLLVFFVLAPPRSRIAKLAWWTLVATYLVSVLLALAKSLVF